MGTIPCFSTIFIKGNDFCDFLFASLDNTPSKFGSTLKGQNLLGEEQILSSFKLTLIEKGSNKTIRVVSPESVSIYLKKTPL